MHMRWYVCKWHKGKLRILSTAIAKDEADARYVAGTAVEHIGVMLLPQEAVDRLPTWGGR